LQKYAKKAKPLGFFYILTQHDTGLHLSFYGDVWNCM